MTGINILFLYFFIFYFHNISSIDVKIGYFWMLISDNSKVIIIANECSSGLILTLVELIAQL